MSSFIVIFATALFVQAVYSCPCGGNRASPISINTGYGGSWGSSNLVRSSGLGNLNLGSSNNVLNIASSSPAYSGYPDGITLVSENEIRGQVAVSGSTPFVASTYFGGSVPSSGSASLSYSAGPAGLNGGGCGYGSGSSGLGLRGSSSGLGLRGSCGCGL